MAQNIQKMTFCKILFKRNISLKVILIEWLSHIHHFHEILVSYIKGLQVETILNINEVSGKKTRE